MNASRSAADRKERSWPVDQSFEGRVCRGRSQVIAMEQAIGDGCPRQ